MACARRLTSGSRRWPIDNLIYISYYLYTLDKLLRTIDVGVERMHTQYLRREGGVLAFDDQGQGPLVLCLPAGGDLRSEYRFLTPQLLAAGYRVVTMDIRGQGETSADWPEYTDAAIGSDMLALMRHLGVSSALLIGTSKATGGALQAALQEPSRVRGL